MIVFDLKCTHAHVFEAWFGSSADYEDQRARGLLTCPICPYLIVCIYLTTCLIFDVHPLSILYSINK